MTDSTHQAMPLACSAPKTPHRIVILTGAGVSAESGIKTFRASDGLWENEPVEKVATPEGFVVNPDRVHAFYNARRRHLLSPDVSPNLGHIALAEAQKTIAAMPDWEWLLVTQNIDNLHERADSKNVLHMHGELLKVHCTRTGKRYDRRCDLTQEEVCECCQISGQLRPSIVWFGEEPLHMDTIFNALQQATLFISIGTSGNVYPAAGFFRQAQLAGAHTVELNLEPSMNADEFDEQHYGKATEVIPAYFKALLQS